MCDLRINPCTSSAFTFTPSLRLLCTEECYTDCWNCAALFGYASDFPRSLSFTSVFRVDGQRLYSHFVQVQRRSIGDIIDWVKISLNRCARSGRLVFTLIHIT